MIKEGNSKQAMDPKENSADQKGSSNQNTTSHNGHEVSAEAARYIQQLFEDESEHFHEGTADSRSRRVAAHPNNTSAVQHRSRSNDFQQSQQQQPPPPRDRIGGATQNGRGPLGAGSAARPATAARAARRTVPSTSRSLSPSRLAQSASVKQEEEAQVRRDLRERQQQKEDEVRLRQHLMARTGTSSTGSSPRTQNSNDALRLQERAEVSSRNSNSSRVFSARSLSSQSVDRARDEMEDAKLCVGLQASVEQQLQEHFTAEEQHSQREQQQSSSESYQADHTAPDTNVLVTPGAFSVHGVEATRRERRESIGTGTTNDGISSPVSPSSPTIPLWGNHGGTPPVSSAQQNPVASHSRTTTTATTGMGRGSGREFLAVAAVVVPDDLDEGTTSLTQKQLELQEKEARLIEQAAKLKAWEAELERQRQQLHALHHQQQQLQVAPAAPAAVQAEGVRAVRAPPRTSSMGGNRHNRRSSGDTSHHSGHRWFQNRGRVSSHGSHHTDSSDRRSVSQPRRRISLREDSVDFYCDDQEHESGAGGHSSVASSSGAMDAGIVPTAEVQLAPSSQGGSISRHNSFATLTSHSDGSLGIAPLAPAEMKEAVSSNISTSSAISDDPGPMRFAPLPTEPSFIERLSALSIHDRRAFKNLKHRWEDRQDKMTAKHGFQSGKVISDYPLEWHLRFLYANQKHHKGSNTYTFSEERSWASLRKLHKRFVDLNVYQLYQQLESKTLFPVPGLRTKDGHDMFYMRPSRYFPSNTSVQAIIDNLCYVINTMLEKNSFAQQEGIGFIACMDNWKMKNFDVTYCYQFMMALQGFMVPVKTQLFLIVNPPSWFGAIWKIMRPMLAPSFRKRVKICPESKIAKYLAPDFREFLPDDMSSGTASTDDMVKDFLKYRVSVEKNPSNHASGVSMSSISLSGPMPYMEGTFDPRDHQSLGSSGSLGSVTSSHHEDDDEDDASIHCDIDNIDLLEEEDMKQPANTASKWQPISARSD